MEHESTLRPLWQRKFSEGKMFDRLECQRCLVRFNFAQRPRVTAIARCPRCGSLSVGAAAA